MKILYPLHVTGCDILQGTDKNEDEIAGKDILYAILYFENSDKTKFVDLNK